MDRAGALPDRCVVCNAEAEGYRESRKLFWSPTWFRLLAWGCGIGWFVLGVGGQSRVLTLVFGFAAIALLVAYFFVRSRVDLEIGLCRRHRGSDPLQLVMIAVCFALVLGAIAMHLTRAQGADTVMVSAVGAVVIAAILSSMRGGRAISIARLTAQHTWLANTGKAFRAALRELPR
jgi:glucose uptake protein GlcU